MDEQDAIEYLINNSCDITFNIDEEIQQEIEEFPFELISKDEI